MAELLPLVAFALASAGSPGPNNLLLWTSGMQFGLARTLPHVAGTGLGVGAVAVGVAAGIGVLVATVPGLELGLKAAGSLYLLWLAHRIAGGRVTGGSDAVRPLRLWQAVAFQAVNAKVWVFALAALSAFRPRALPLALGSALTVATMMAVVVVTAVVWAAGGTALGRLVATPRAQRILSGALALLLVASIAQLWR